MEENIKITQIKEKYKTLYDELSSLRKQGADMKIAELNLINIPSKINYANITNAQEDIDKVISLLRNVETEIIEARDTIKRPDQEEQEVEQNDSTKSNAFDVIKDMLDGAAYFMKNAQKSEAIDLYNEIMNQYKMLNKEDKKQVLSQCMELRDIISKKH